MEELQKIFPAVLYHIFMETNELQYFVNNEGSFNKPNMVPDFKV